MVVWSVAAPVAAQSFKSGITTEITLSQTPTEQCGLELRIVMRIPEGLHVYRDRLFEVQVSDSQNLGPMEIELPGTKKIPDAFADDPSAATEVFAGDAVIIARWQPHGRDGEPWAFQGALRYQGCSETNCFPPQEVPFSFAGIVGQSGDPGPAAEPPVLAAPDRVRDQSATAATPSKSNGSTTAADKTGWATKGLWWGMFAAFVAGLLLSLTPCVYPMVGITVAVIGGRQATRGQRVGYTFLYVLGMSLVYALLGVMVALFGSPAAAFLRSAWVLIPVSLIFLLLGLSMFDVFTLQTPSALANKLQGVGRNGGALDVFIMGAVSAFVVGPCVTGPLLALITFVATTGRMLTGFLYFFALAWGMGMILFVAGAASGMLPRAGSWMQDVKHVLGVILVWAAFYFSRPIVGEPAFWAATLTAGVLVVSLLGWLHLPEPGSGWRGSARLTAGVLIVFLLAFGFHWHWTREIGADGSHATVNAPLDLDAELDRGKPVILDFWAEWCANCKKIEKNDLSDLMVQQQLERYNVVRVDYDRNTALVKRFGVIGPPAFIFLDRKGNPTGPTIVTGPELRRRLTIE